MGFPHFDLVQTAQAQLTAEGKIKYRNTQEEVEADKGLLTARAMYLVNTQRDPNFGLLAKGSGNAYMGNSVDWALDRRDGQGYDIASDDGHYAFAMNGDPEGADPARIPDWRQPTKELAQVSDTPTPPPDGGDGGTVPPVDYSARLDALEANIIAHDDANTQRIIDKLDHIVDQAEESLQKILAALVILKRRRNPDDAA